MFMMAHNLTQVSCCFWLFFDQVLWCIVIWCTNICLCFRNLCLNFTISIWYSFLTIGLTLRFLQETFSNLKTNLKWQNNLIHFVFSIKHKIINFWKFNPPGGLKFNYAKVTLPRSRGLNLLSSLLWYKLPWLNFAFWFLMTLIWHNSA